MTPSSFRAATFAFLAAATALPAHAQPQPSTPALPATAPAAPPAMTATATGAYVVGTPSPRVERGNLVMEGVPESDPAIVERLNRYQQTRGAALQGVMPDGSLLIATRFGDTAQVHRVAMPMGDRKQLTFYPEPIGGALPHPSRNGFVFAKDIGGNEFFQYHWFDAASGETRLLTDGKSRNSGAVWNRDGTHLAFSTTKRNGRDTDVHLVGLEPGAASQPLVEKEGEWTAVDFAPDGRTLLVRKGISINESELWFVDVATKAMTRFHPAGEPVFFGDAKFSADGKRVIYVSDEGNEFRVLRMENRDGSAARLLSEAPFWNVEALELSPDGQRLAYVTNADGLAQLHLLELRAGGAAKVRAPALPVGQVTGLAFAPDGQRIALSLDASVAPSDAYAFRFGDSKLVRWTESEVGGLDTRGFVVPQLVRYPSFDGRSIPAFVYRPAAAAGNAARRLPVIINIHGGPEAQALPSFTPGFQFYVKELGIAVITPNVRGSDGYGKSYLKLDNGMLREDSVKDIGALLDWIAAQPDLDKDRVLVTGGSYGGYMTLASMTHYNDRLRAGIDVVGISHFGTFLKNTQDYRRDLRRVEYGDERIPEMAAFMERTAPLNNAAKITRPMFIVQGLNDPRVPASEAEQMVAKIRANGGSVWYLAAKDEGHGFRKKGNRDFQAAATVQFLQQTLLAP